MPPVPQAVSAVRDAVRAALAGDPVPVVLPDIPDDDLVAEAVRQRVAGLLVHGGLRESVDERLRSVADVDRMAVLRQVRQMEELACALTDVPFLSIKGPLLAIQTTGDFAARGFGDIDVLVSLDDVADVHDRLADAGWRPYGKFPRPGPSWAWRHLLRSYCELPLHGARSAVDLHWALAPTRGRLPTFAEAWARREEVPLAGRRWATLNRGDALRHACVHAATDSWRWLRSLVDIHRLASQDQTWSLLESDLGPTELTTLRVVRDRIGLPAAVPERVLTAIDDVPRRRLAVANWGVEMLENHDAGNWTTQSLIARLGQSTSITEGLGAISSAILPAHSLADVHSAHAAVAIPQALGRRGRIVTGKVRGRWRRPARSG
jgi:hypothetical protein